MKKLLFLLLVPWVVFAQPNQGGGPFPTPQINGVPLVPNPFTTNAIPSNISFPLGTYVAGNNESLGVLYLGTNPPFANAGFSWVDRTFPNTNGGFISYSMNPFDNAYGTDFINPLHDNGGPGPLYCEYQCTRPHNWAIAPGYLTGSGLLQIGAGNVDNTHTNGGLSVGYANMGTTKYSYGHSVATWFYCSSGDNNGNDLIVKRPGFVGVVTDTNAATFTWRLSFFPDINNTGGITTGPNQGTWNVDTLNTNGFQIINKIGTKASFAFDGNAGFSNGIVAYTGTPGYSILGANSDLSQYEMIVGNNTVVLGNGISARLQVKTDGTHIAADLGSVSNSFGVFPITSDSGYAGLLTNRVTIAATGYTNTMTVNGQGVDVDVYFKAATATLSDSFGTSLHAYTVVVTDDSYAHMKPNWRLVGTTMTGDAIAH